MSQPPGRTRIAQALREDAGQEVRGDLDLWPYIRARVSSRQSAALSDITATDLGPQASTERNGPGRAARPERQFHHRTRRPILNISLASGLPVLALALFMTLYMVGAYFAPTDDQSWFAVRPEGRPDPCTLITQQEVDSVAGKHLEQYRWQPVRPMSYACAYSSADTAINVLAIKLSSVDEAHRYVRNRLLGISGGTVPSLAQEDQVTYGRPVTNVGDEAYIAWQNGSMGSDRYFWHVVARQGDSFFMVTWMTNRADPADDLKTLAQLVSERMRDH
jgi:hypothetical protein